MLNKLMKLKNKKGFTLVELIVVIAIIAILTAIIVPLVGRYSAQARYTTLNDAATTISSSANTALSDGNQIGALTAGSFTGSRSGTTFSATFTPSSGTAVTINSDTGAAVATNDNAATRATKRLYSSLKNALSGDCTFYVKVSNASVEGVVYSTDSTITAADGLTITAVTGFDKAYETSSVAIGVSGCYIPGSTTTPSTPSTPSST